MCVFSIEPCIVRSTTMEFDYYPFMVSLGNCSGSCNVADDLSTQMYVLRKTKDLHFIAFNIITRINVA